MKLEVKQIGIHPNQLQAKWTVEMTQDLETQYSEDMARILQEEIDWEIMIDMMVKVGWTKVEVDWPERIDETKAHEIKEWCKETLQGNYNGRGKIWLFERSEDAMWFSLRWSS